MCLAALRPLLGKQIKNSVSYCFQMWSLWFIHLNIFLFYEDGTGESFVFLFVDEALQKFKWTQENELIMFSNHEKVGMGAGADGFAFLLDADFYTGGSYRSSTFGNPPLASKENFRVKNVEVWGFESALQVPPKRKIRNK